MSESEQDKTQGTSGQRGRRNEKLGVVVSAKMQKSVVVAVERVAHHPLYRKAIRRTSTFMPRGAPRSATACASSSRDRCRATSAGACARSSSAPRWSAKRPRRGLARSRDGGAP
jgi:hypothetical protein